MHIAFLTPEFPHPRVQASAGIGTSLKNLIQGVRDFEDTLSRKPSKITLFIYGQKESDSWEEEGIQFHVIAHKKYRLGGVIRYRSFVNKYINTIIKKENIDILEAPDWTGITAYMKFSIPLVVRLHGSDTYFCSLEGRDQKKKNYHLEKKALRGADAITSVSQFTAHETSRLFSLSTPIDIIHNAIDISFFSPSAQDNQEDTILYFGSVIRKKGVLELAKAFKQVLKKKPKAQLIFLGKDVRDIKEGVSTSKLIKNSIAEENMPQVQFISQVSYNEVKNYINTAGIICLPSHAEAFPMTWLEAMAMAKPLVTSNVGWAQEIMIHEKTGLTVNPNNIDELAQALLRLLHNPEEARSFGNFARTHLVANFDPIDIAKQNIEFYKKVLQG